MATIRDVWRSLPINKAGVRKRWLPGTPYGGLELVWHHTAGNPNATPRDVAAVHLAQGWPHIGYHYLIAPDGTITKTLPLRYRPICVRGHNNWLVCVAFVGNYQTRELHSSQIEAAGVLLGLLRRYHRISRLAGHRDYTPTLCPGENAYRQLRQAGLIDRPPGVDS